MSITASILAAGLLFASMLPVFGPEKKSSDPQTSDTRQVLIDFSNSSAAGWQIVNDSVMGGISRTTLQMHEDGYALFSGTVSLENNGGFASVRTRAQAPVDLSGFEGLSVHVLGDGKTYSLRLRTVKNGRLTNYSYEARFATTAGVWETHQLAYSDFMDIPDNTDPPESGLKNTLGGVRFRGLGGGPIGWGMVLWGARGGGVGGGGGV
ncbi:MAG: CIA30 family protein, partial [Balneolaceae bacterium]|nr:CIA30 family protein [Balneolaceae bacterium]